MKDLRNYSLLKHNTFGIPAEAKRFVEFDSSAEVQQFLQKENLSEQKYFVIGGGSNLLFLRDFDGLILHSAISDIEVLEESEQEIRIRVGSGVNWDEFVAYCVCHNWGGLENLSLIPGEVGASAVQNIGAYGAEAGDRIYRIEAYSLQDASFRSFVREECEYAYRSSIFKKEQKNRYFITHVCFSLEKRPVLNLEYKGIRELLPTDRDITLNDVRQAIITLRNSKLPSPEEYGNAGSFFMNPVVPVSVLDALRKKYDRVPFYQVDDHLVKIPAAWFIDQCGWKGKARGRAAVYAKQPLVLINTGGAKAEEIVDLAAAIINDVYKNFSVRLQPEVNYVE